MPQSHGQKKSRNKLRKTVREKECPNKQGDSALQEGDIVNIDLDPSIQNGCLTQVPGRKEKSQASAGRAY